MITRRTEPGWTVEPGRYEVLIATSSAEIVHRVEVDVASSVTAPETDP